MPMFWRSALHKTIELVGACLHFLCSLVQIPKRCVSKCSTSSSSESGPWTGVTLSTSLRSGDALEGTNKRLSSVTDAKFPAECPRELSDDGMSHSRSSKKIQELDRYIELLHQEVMLRRQELSGVRKRQQEVAEAVDDVKKFFFG